MANSMLAIVGLLLAIASADDNLADVVFYGDVGKAREYKDYLVSPWPMDKSSQEGAFSLYEGMYDYIVNRGARPKDVLVLGDVGYYGGDAKGLNYTIAAHQKYFDGRVPLNRVFPVIGNHDIHFLGCGPLEKVHVIQEEHCYYGTKTGRMLAGFFSQPQMSYDQWQRNWLESFPGLAAHGISPIRQSDSAVVNVAKWPLPMRYNIDPGSESRVYIIVGLITGSSQLRWQDDTPLGAFDGMVSPEASGIECSFLHDSLEHGRSLGKTIFIYATHHFDQACSDWSLVQQIDVWLYGHKHTYWQSVANGGNIIQEQRYYPTKVLIGNGGFDEANINVVSFGRLREETFESNGSSRVRLHFDIQDTCVVSDTSCPLQTHTKNPDVLKQCWTTCKDIPGGFDGGGGRRKAIPSTHGFGFTFEAPAHQTSSSTLHQAPFGGSWKVQLGSGDASRWLALGTCGSWSFAKSGCLVSESNVSKAATFTLYDSISDNNGMVSVRFAVENARRAPITQQVPSNALWQSYGFWDIESIGFGRMRPSDGFKFRFAKDSAGWQVLGVEWRTDYGDGHGRLAVADGVALAVNFRSTSDADDSELFV